MQVDALRCYPVKSMGGEPREAVRLDGRGVAGDRWYAVVDGDGRLASGKDTRRFRRRDAVFSYSAGTATAGHAGDPTEVVVTDGSSRWPVGGSDLDETLSRAMGTPVRVRPEAGVAHHDAGAVSLVGTATLAWCAEQWGIRADPRRLRANVVITTDEPFVEEGWVGQRLVIGEVTLAVTGRIPRCRMIDLDQDGVRADGGWLKPLTRERDMRVAMYADVATPGTVRVGDAVSLG